jgi:hypothetical protein
VSLLDHHYTLRPFITVIMIAMMAFFIVRLVFGAGYDFIFYSSLGGLIAGF